MGVFTHHSSWIPRGLLHQAELVHFTFHNLLKNPTVIPCGPFTHPTPPGIALLQASAAVKRLTAIRAMLTNPGQDLNALQDEVSQLAG